MLFDFWHSYITPIFRRPPYFQVAALCYRHTAEGLEVLLITSLDTGRWILPKGWPQAGLDAGGTALEEAWEEAGIKHKGPRPALIGSYRYDKRLKGGIPAHTKVDVFAIEVVKLLDTFPEAGQRERRWMTPDKAATLVDEPALAELLRNAPTLLHGAPRG
ncbi:MAG: NUDIX hydrolase [Rhodobacteraceae bacterium]|nr:NUDIX hydrolase [Paracoccaceae bacterium]MAY45590.1 NUDIX hydrolase [Paracoccaceae bacterium]QEW20665.1 NUDIX domain protein [Marinibacterium anthonyi]